MISLLLIAVLLVSILPVSVFAASASDAQVPPGVTTVTNPDYVEPGAVRELESRREENVKHFLLPDNTVQAVVYADAVHRKDDSGNWQDISNDLTLTEYKGVKFYTTADDRVVFAEKFAPNAQLWQLSENGYSVAMGMAQLQLSADATVTPMGGVTVTNAPVRRSASTWHSVEEARVVDNTASIVYSNVKADTDLEYIMVGNDIKENIVVKARSNSYTYQFNMTLTGLMAILNENGSISLIDSVTGQQQYIIPAPYMVDAAGNHSDAVSYTLKNTGEGQYALTVTADSRWINAADRAFPVKIDPTLRGPVTFDTYIDSNHPNQTYHDSDWLYLADHTAVFFLMYVPNLPAGAALVEAKFNVFYYYYDNVTSGFIYAAAYRVDQPWQPDEQTWNAANQRINLGISPTPLTIEALMGNVNAYEDSPALASFNITSTVQSWYNGTTNYGIALRYYDGSNSGVILNSMENIISHQPYLTVTYSEQRLADGVYSLQNVGTGLYLDVRGGGYTAGTVVQQYSAAAEGYERNQLFKITFLETVGGDNYYSVRSMTNSGLGLSAALTLGSSGVVLDTMSTAEVYDNDAGETMWAIVSIGASYTLKNGDSTAGGYLTASNGAVGTQVRTAQSITNNSKWDLIPYTGEELQGIFISSNVTEINIGATIDLDAVVYSSLTWANGPASFVVYDPDMTMTQKATINPTTGVLTAVSGGTIKVGVRYEGCSLITYHDIKIKTETCKRVLLDVYYDVAYTNAVSDHVNRIKSQVYALQEIYINVFDIWIDFVNPTLFNCYACENCTTDPEEPCDCVNETLCRDTCWGENGWEYMLYHHTNYTNIMYRIPYRGPNVAFCVGYFAHSTCISKETTDGHTHHLNPYGGLTCNSNVCLSAVTDWEDYDKETRTLIHEFGHIYGAKDHHGQGAPTTKEMNGGNNTGPYNELCIYGENNENATTEDGVVICDGCKADIIMKNDYYSHT